MGSVAHYSGGLDMPDLEVPVPQGKRPGQYRGAGANDDDDADAERMYGEINADIGSDLDEEEDEETLRVDENSKRISIYAANLAKQLGVGEEEEEEEEGKEEEEVVGGDKIVV